MSGEDEGRQPPQHPYWTRLRQSFGQGGESSSAIEEEEEANQPTPESQYSSSSSDTEDFEQVPEEVPNLELHRGRIPERMQQRGNAPRVDAVIPGGNQVRQSNYRNWNNQGPNQRLQAQAAGWNNQRNQDRDGGNHPCTYCGISGHRQGPECPLWCKHRSERGMPIVQYNNRGNQPQQRPPAQLNAVILEEVEPEQPEDYLKTIQQESDDILRADKDCCSKGKTSKHFQCDCTECISIEEVPDNQKIPETMAVTRSGKKKEVHVQEKGEQQPMDWSAQDQIRMGVLKEINSANKQKEETRRSTLPYAGTNQKKIGWKEPIAVDQEQVKKREEAQRMSEKFFEALMNAPTQISLRQILGLVPSFADKFMQKLQNQYGIRKILDVRQEADLVQEPEWAEDEHGQQFGKPVLGSGTFLPQKVCKEDVEISNIELGVFKVTIRVGEAVRFRMQTKYSQKEYRLDILRVSEKKSSQEVMQKRSKTIAGEKMPVKESLGSKERAAEQDAMGNRRGRSSTKQSPTVLVDDDDDHEDMGFQPSPVATKGRTTTEHNFLEFKVEIDPLQANNARWLKRIGLLDYALLPWAHWRFTTQTGMIMAQLLEFNGLVGHGVYLSASLVAKVFDLPEGLDNTVDKASEEDMDGEFGKGEGSRNYFILKNVQNQERLQQIKWFLERVMLLVKLDYISRENYAILSWAEKGRRFGWATMLYERIHSEIFSKEKKRVQRSTKVGPLITAIYMHVRNNAVLRALNPSGSHQAADRQEEDIQEGCSQPIGVRKAAQEAKQKMLDQQGGATELYRSLLSAGYSHEECMETVGLDKSVELPKFWGKTSVPTREFKTPITVSTVKKPIRLRKRKVESVAGQEPQLTQQGQDTGPVQEKEQKAENEELKKNLETNLLNRAKIEGLQEQIRLLTVKLQAKEEKLDFYQKQLSRRISTAQMYKKWQEEWSAILNKELDMLFATNARLEADNKVLLNRVTACKEVEEKIRDCTDEELVIDGWYLPAQEVDDMKAELRRQGEQIWMNFGKKMEEVISKPYQIFAKEENSEELLLLQSQLEDLQGKFNFLQEQQSEKEHKKADDSQVDEEFNVKGKRSAVEKFCFDEEPVQQTGEEDESSDLHTLISKIAGDLEKPVKSLEILSDVVITSKNVDDKEQDEKQDDVVKEKDELLVDVQNIKEQETVAEQQQDVVMEAVGDVQAIQDVVLYEAEKKDAD
ncbi:hypothetical protein L7F22_056511 [Adiantum nelumboides]|nr:hypothetical protein [Adiantum nelumboides]